MWKNDAVFLSGQLGEGKITPVELLKIYQQRIDRLNPKLNAIICLSKEAEAEAEASTERYRKGRPISPIDGIPIAIKDNLVVRGMPATWGSRLYEGRISNEDEIPVQKLRQAGAIIIGKTNVPEFTVEGYTDNKLFGVTANPWNMNVTPGGSSGGSVSAVASGLVPLAIGTDGGGSIRRPVAYTNLVGLKPGIGRIARGGGLPQILLDMEVVGPITRSVRDQALLLNILAGPDNRDHSSLKFQNSDIPTDLTDTPKGLNILAVERFGDAPLDGEISHSFGQMVGVVKEMGHHVTTGQLPLDIREISELWTTIGNIGLGLLLKNEPRMRELASQKYVEWADTPYDAAHLLHIGELITKLRDQAAIVFADIDMIMTPTCAAMPWATDIPFPPEIDGHAVGPRGSAIYTGWVNACGHPAISIPGKMSSEQMPIGIQFVANTGKEELLLQLARQIENRQSWLDQWPDIALEMYSHLEGVLPAK